MIVNRAESHRHNEMNDTIQGEHVKDSQRSEQKTIITNQALHQLHSVPLRSKICFTPKFLFPSLNCCSPSFSLLSPTMHDLTNILHKSMWDTFSRFPVQCSNLGYLLVRTTLIGGGMWGLCKVNESTSLLRHLCTEVSNHFCRGLSELLCTCIGAYKYTE